MHTIFISSLREPIITLPIYNTSLLPNQHNTADLTAFGTTFVKLVSEPISSEQTESSVCWHIQSWLEWSKECNLGSLMRQPDHQSILLLSGSSTCWKLVRRQNLSMELLSLPQTPGAVSSLHSPEDSTSFLAKQCPVYFTPQRGSLTQPVIQAKKRHNLPLPAR